MLLSLCLGGQHHGDDASLGQRCFFDARVGRGHNDNLVQDRAPLVAETHFAPGEHQVDLDLVFLGQERDGLVHFDLQIVVTDMWLDPYLF